MPANASAGVSGVTEQLSTAFVSLPDGSYAPNTPPFVSNNEGSATPVLEFSSLSSPQPSPAAPMLASQISIGALMDACAASDDGASEMSASTITSAVTTPRGDVSSSVDPNEQFIAQVEQELKREFLSSGGQPGAPSENPLTPEQLALKDRMKLGTEAIASGCPVPLTDVNLKSMPCRFCSSLREWSVCTFDQSARTLQDLSTCIINK